MRKLRHFVTMVLLLLLAAAFLAACGGNGDEDDATDINGTTDNVHTPHTADHGDLPPGLVLLTADFAETAELLLAELDALGVLSDRHVQVSRAYSEGDFAISHSNVVLDFDNPATFGWVAVATTRGDLPMWLNVGVEAIARSNVGLFVPTATPNFPPVFADLNFQPAEWGGHLHLQSIDTAYHFVRHMLANGDLSRLIDLYSDVFGADETANVLAQELFAAFSGQATRLDTAFRLRIFERSESVEGNVISAAYVIDFYTEMARHRFIFEDFEQQFSTPDLLARLQFSDDSIRFAYDWWQIGSDFDMERINVYLIYAPRARVGVGFDWTEIVRFDVGENLPMGTTSDAWYIISRRNGLLPLYAPFIWGTRTAVQGAFYGQDWANRGLIYSYFMYEFNAEEMLEPFAEFFYMFFNDMDVALVAAHNFLETDYRFLTTQNHLNVYWAVNIGWVEFFGHELGYDEINMLLQTWWGGASLVMFLLENYGAQNFQQLRGAWPTRSEEDFSRLEFPAFEEIYGMTFIEMLDLWLEYVNDFVWSFVD